MSGLSGKTMSHSRIFSILLLLILIPIFLSATVTRAEAAASDNLAIRINRAVQIEDGGTVVMNDTISISSVEATQISTFSIGFPYQYKKNLVYVFAYDDSNSLNVTLETGLGRMGFYGLSVQLPAIEVTEDRPYDFTVVYVFCDLVTSETAERFRIDFPLYPSLAQEVEFCNVTVILPPRTTHSIELEPSFYPSFNTSMRDIYEVLNITQSPLEPFSDESSWVIFEYSGHPKEFYLIELNEMRREFLLDSWGNLLASDYYCVTNKAIVTRTELYFYLPRNATDISARDVYGSLRASGRKDSSYTYVTVSLRKGLNKDDKVKLTINYRLPLKEYVKQDSWNGYTLSLNFTRHSWILEKVTVKITLPEGAEFNLNPEASAISPSSFKKDIFQESVTFVDLNFTKFHDLDLNLSFRYEAFWASFRPTSWVGILAAMACAVLFIKRAPVPTVAIEPVPMDTLREFVEKYEEKTRIMTELKRMERRVQTGKMSRRRYRLRRSSLDGRLSKLQRDLTDLQARIEAAGGLYAQRMRQLEVTEAELEALEENIRRVNARYRRKEISKEAHRRLLDEYNRRRLRAENTISGIILRLREEIR